LNLYGYVLGDPVVSVDPSGFAVWGINAGGGFTFRGMKYSFSTAILLDSNGAFSVITSQEAGAGKGNAAGLFFNGVWGGENTYNCHYSGTGTSLSGTSGFFSTSVSLPDYGDAGEPHPFYELGFGQGVGTREGGATRTFGEDVYSSDILGRTGRWWGRHIYEWTH
jgi:hypothetical protein